MKRLLLLLAIALLVGSLLIGVLAQDGGYVLISLFGYSLETSFWFALLVVFVSVSAVWFCLWLLVGGLRGLVGVTRVVVHGSEESNRRLLAAGLVDFMEGNWKLAHKKLLKTADRSIVPVINYLAAARSSYELGDREQAHQLLAKAEKVAPQHTLAIALAQARIELLDQRYEQCLATLERVRKNSPHHPVVLDILRQAYVALEDWSALQLLLPDLKKYKPLKDAELVALELRCHQHLLRNAVDKARGGDVLAALQKAWAQLDAKVQREAAVLLSYVELLIAHGGNAIAENSLRKTLQKNWDDRLLHCYGKIAGDDIGKQLLYAEGWLKERPRNAVLLLALGRLSLRNQLWGKAREYFEASLKIQPQPETFAELARLMAALGEHQLSTGYYQQGLKLITNSLPELPVPESHSKFGQATSPQKLSGH